MSVIQRLLRSTVFPTALLGLVDGAVVFQQVDWTPEQVAWVNGAIATWVVVAKVIFEIDLHRLDDGAEVGISEILGVDAEQEIPRPEDEEEDHEEPIGFVAPRPSLG